MSPDNEGRDPYRCEDCGAYAPDEHRSECPYSDDDECPSCEGTGLVGRAGYECKRCFGRGRFSFDEL